MPNPVSLPPSPPAINSHHSLWDTFEQTLLFISLYILAISIELSFYIFINKWFPLVAYSESTYASWVIGDLDKFLLRVYIAQIIVTYPLFAFLFLRTTRKTKENPQLRNLMSRKIFIYMTLVITFIINLAFIILSILALLSGNMSLNFVLHFAVTLVINGGLFLFYFLQIKEDRHFQYVR